MILITIAGFTLIYATYDKLCNGYDVMQLHAHIWKGLFFCVWVFYAITKSPPPPTHTFFHDITITGFEWLEFAHKMWEAILIDSHFCTFLTNDPPFFALGLKFIFKYALKSRSQIDPPPPPWTISVTSICKCNKFSTSILNFQSCQNAHCINRSCSPSW